MKTVDDIEAWLKEPSNIYIGRETNIIPGSKWGNQFELKRHNNCRPTVVRLFEKHLENNSELLKSIPELVGKTLGCWCTPELCHGSVLERLAGNIPVQVRSSEGQSQITMATKQSRTYKLFLDARKVFTSYQFPEDIVMTICDQLGTNLPTVIALEGKNKGAYMMAMQDYELYTTLSTTKITFHVPKYGKREVKFVEYDEFKGRKRRDWTNEQHGSQDGNEYEEEEYEPPQRKRGRLITFKKAAYGELSAIPNSVFDAVVEAKCELIKPTCFQVHKGTEAFNGNRYCVIEKDFKFPRTIQVNNPSTNRLMDVEVRYKGQEYMCRRCAMIHTGACPEIKEYYEQKDRRKQLEINTKIYSDSTLRRGDVTGLKAEIDCASGARVGHIANMVRDDEFTDDANNEIVINMGLNNILDEDEEYEVYKKRTEMELAKLRVNIEVKPVSKVTIVAPILDNENATAETIHKFNNIKAITKKTFQDVEKVVYKDINGHPRIEMEGTHPTIAGTRELLTRIDGVQKIIVDPRFMVNERNLYGEVNSHFLYGCLLCDRIWDIQNGYCAECRTMIMNHIGWDEEIPGGKRDRTPSQEETTKRPNLNSTPTDGELVKTYNEVVIKPITAEEVEIHEDDQTMGTVDPNMVEKK